MPNISHDSHKFEWLTARGWPLLPCHPRDKRPLTAHGVKDASTDPEVIAAWLDRWPDANWAVACGHPGPQVLDIDSLERAAVPRNALSIFRSAPRVKTGRGWHLYFSGTAASTVTFEWGELRGVGSYVLIPPSIHPSGASYMWQIEPRGPLPKVPGACAGTERSTGAGRGRHVAPVQRVPHGCRHLYLRGFAVHLLRGGLVDGHLIECHLRCEFERICEPLPAPEPGDFAALARWAVQSRIAERERRNGR